MGKQKCLTNHQVCSTSMSGHEVGGCVCVGGGSGQLLPFYTYHLSIHLQLDLPSTKRLRFVCERGHIPYTPNHSHPIIHTHHFYIPIPSHPSFTPIPSHPSLHTHPFTPIPSHPSLHSYPFTPIRDTPPPPPPPPTGVHPL